MKSLLRCNVFYYALFLIAISYFLISYFFVSFSSVYTDFSSSEFKIIEKTREDYGIKFVFLGEEKVIGYLYLDSFMIDSYYDDYNLGDMVLVYGNNVSIRNNTVFNTFNYKSYLYSEKVYSVIKISSMEKVSDNKNLFYGLKNLLIKRGLCLNKSYPYINSLIFGDNSYLDSDVVLSYRGNGISHLFAISGTHINILLGIFYVFLKKIGFGERKRCFFSIFFLLFYMFLTGFSMSVLRASIFAIGIIINKLFNFKVSSVNVLIFCFFIMMMVNPFSLFNIGFLFSILISFYLILFSDIFNRDISFVRKTFLVSYVSFLVSFPILVNNFYQVNFMSVFYNLFFVPFVSFVLLPFVFASYVFVFLDDILYFLILLNEKVSLFLYSFTFPVVTVCKMSVFFIVVYFIVISINFKMMKRGKVWFNFVVIFFIVFLCFRSNLPNGVTFIDVSQGDSTLITFNKKVVLIDTGGVLSYGDKEYKYPIANNRILPFLRSKGIKRINYLVISHGDVDHARDAFFIVDNFKVDKVIFNCGAYNDLEKELIKILNKKNIEYYSCIKELNIDNNRLYFLHTGEYDNENDNSNVIYTKLGGYKFLFMGDASVDREKDVLDKYNLNDIDFLKVGHHGSGTSSSDYFINRVNPKYSLISVGENNRYGHPKKEVLDVLSSSKVYRTDLDGSIEVKLNKDGYKIRTCRP